MDYNRMLTRKDTNYIGLELHRALYHAVIKNDIKSSQYLLENGANPNYTNNTKEHFTPLHWTAILPDSENLCRLLLNNGAKPNWIDTNGKTALHYAAFWGHIKIVKLLLSNTDQININALDVWHGTPLFYATKKGHLAVVKQLIKKGVNVNPNYNSTYSIKRFGQWLNGVKTIQYTPLIKAVQNNDIDIVHCLMQAGADINTQDAHHNTALHYAVSHQNIPMVALLIQNGANVGIKNADNHTPQSIAVLEKKEKVLAYLSGNLQKQLDWSTPALRDVANLLILLNSENRLSLVILSQMHRTAKNQPTFATYFRPFFFQLMPIYQSTYQTNTMYLPIEIWQRITAFWLQDTLSIDICFDQLHTITGNLFAHIHDLMPSKRYAM